VSAHPACYLCNGKDCRRAEGHGDLRKALRAVGKVQVVKCQDLCEGPVAGVVVDGKVEWFEKLRRARHRDAVVALAVGAEGKVPADLRDRWARKHQGKIKR
jgi:hypothetical protein